MAYQNSSPNIYGAPVTTPAAKEPMSRWWPIGIFIASVVFFVIGGGLLGAWGSSSSCYYDSYDYYDYGVCSSNTGEFYGGIAMLVIGAILKFVFWIILIVWCVQRRRSRAASTVIYVNAQANAEAGHPDKNQPQSNVYPVPQATYTGVPQQEYTNPPAQDYTGVQVAPVYGSAQAQAPGAEKQAVTKYCGNCGTGTTTPYCSRCGTQVL